MLRTKSFWLFIVWLVLVSSGGLGLISQAAPAAQEVLDAGGGNLAGAAMLATAAMGSVSLCNGLGRLLNGYVWDRFGYRASLLWISLSYVASMGLCAFAIAQASYPLIIAGFMLLGLVYGGCMCGMSAMCGSFFGTKYYSVNYAVATCQMIVSASAGPLILAAMQGSSGSYYPAFCAFMLVAGLALLLSFFVKSPEEHR